MKVFVWVSAATMILAAGLSAQQASSQARLEDQGDALAARQALYRAAQQSPEDPSALLRYAEFLDEYRDPDTRSVYEKALTLLNDPADRIRRERTARRLVLLDLIAGDRDAAAKHLQAYHAAGGAALPASLPDPRPDADGHQPTIEIPGPLGSFGRMAAISPDLVPADVLPAIARNMVTNGYQALPTGDTLEPTEYLKLITRYVSQARELERLAGDQKIIRIEACESAKTAELLRILGYRMRGGCGSEVVLDTVNASRAFLTIDSGFPLAELEQALRTNRPFQYDYRPTYIPILYGADYWVNPNDKSQGDPIDVFLSDPSLCRLYVAMAALDPETVGALRRVAPLPRLKLFAHVLDFFGGMFEVRGGKATVPGGARSAAMWAELVGVSPDKGGEFFERLISKDDGWMASYFDALARISGPVQDYLTEPQRMKRFYMAIRGRVTSPGPARPVFRSNTDMLLLTTRLRLDANGKPHVPGDLGVWKDLFTHRRLRKFDSKLARSASNWKEPDDVIEALFGMCRKTIENEPLKVFLALSDLDRYRAQPLEPATVLRLAQDYDDYGAQYSLFAEFPTLRDQTILQYLDTAKSIDEISNTLLRADTAGTMQALAALWQIFCRQGSIPAAQADAALARILTPFAKLRRDTELFDAGRQGVTTLLQAARSPERGDLQGRMLALLAGATATRDADSEAQIVQEMVRIFEAQRLISLDNLFDLADSLELAAQGQKVNPTLLNRIASRIAEIPSPRASLTAREKNSLSFGYWTDRHIDAERKMKLRVRVDRAGADAGKLRDIRGDLAPFLRDTLVGFCYMHYAPPGAQLLLANPVFVRSHDFVGLQGADAAWKTTDTGGGGWPFSAGGRLVGSLSGLPYALADIEQNFMVPRREQALIWADLVPQIVLSATVPRWWNVTPSQLHWVGLHMRYAETLVAEGALDAGRRGEVTEVLVQHAPPARVYKVARFLDQGDVHDALRYLTPAEMFALARHMLTREKNVTEFPVRELQRLQRESPARDNYEAISRAFGTPKPTLTNSYRPELLYLRTFPTLMGFSSRILAESWESTPLYWADLADEVHASPSQLNVLIPEWTMQTVEAIFATSLDDWPALLRSVRKVGEEVRMKSRMQMSAEQKASLE